MKRPAQTSAGRTAPGDAPFRAAARAIPEAIWMTDARDRCSFVNPAWERLTGIPADASGGDGWLDALCAEDRARVREALAGARSSGLPFRCVCRSAAGRTLEIAGAPVPGTGRVRGCAGTARETDAPPPGGEDPYRTVFEQANDAMLILEPDTELILDANGRACELYGTTREALVGTSLKMRTVNVGRGELQIARTLREGTCTGFETVHLRDDGTPVSLTVNSSVIIYRGDPAILSIARGATTRREAEEYMSRALAWQEAIFEGSADAAFILDGSGRIMAVNRAAQELSGRGAGELTRLQFVELTPQAERADTLDRCAEAFGRGRLVWQGMLERTSAEAVPAEFSASPVEVAGSTYLRLSARDVRAQRETERRLALSEQRYRLFVDQSKDGIWRLEAREPIPVDLPEDEQIERMYRLGVVVEANDAFARMHGCRTAAEVIGTGLDVFVPRSQPEYVEYVRMFIRSGYRLLDAESRTVDARGRLVYHQTTFFGTVEHGCLVSAWGSQRDITERLQNERKIRLLAQTIASAKDCVYLSDLSGTVLYANDAFLATYGYAEDDLLGSSITRLHAATEEDRAGAAAGGGGWYGEILSRRRDGGTFPVELWTSLVRNDDGEPVAIVGVARDITERKRAEEQIRRSLREKEVLLKEIHHRVKNNLQVISSLLNLQSEYIQDPEMLRIFKESQFRVRSMALVHEKLYRSASLAEIDLAEYIDELSTQLFRSFGLGRQGVQLEVQVDAGMLGIDMAIPCGIILNELLTNALKYAFPDDRPGTVYVEMSRDGTGHAVLVVGDTGVGMPAALDIRTTDSLGLKLVTMLTEQLGGTLTLANAGRRRGSATGTEFAIRFPADNEKGIS